jgi:thiosulfate reductase cytochrome b subunit
MLMSGWAIYNASPIFAFRFPVWATVGGWLGGSIAWHFAAMWLLAANGLVYFAYGFASGHTFRESAATAVMVPRTLSGLAATWAIAA